MEAGYPYRAKLPKTKTRGFRPAFAGLPGRLTATKNKYIRESKKKKLISFRKLQKKKKKKLF
jgi:hypothetical protein